MSQNICNLMKCITPPFCFCFFFYKLRMQKSRRNVRAHILVYSTNREIKNYHRANSVIGPSGFPSNKMVVRFFLYTISSLMEENNMPNETHENAKKEFQNIIATFEVQLKEHTSNETTLKTELENLKAEIQDYAGKTSLKNLEETLTAAQNTIVEQAVTAKAKEQVTEEVTSRDIGSIPTTPSKRKSKKSVEPASTPSTSNTQLQATNDSFGTSFKFIVGFALVSVIIGIVLGKRY
ncbi:hypothetical protein CTI12_AA319010 [Artemisia annua]|uniref:Uncharacterized protein n=1 Tax=Artemisia annua TaxID=35608 RepID=A0A2U1N1H7_ARTAN|nr:hypothetical protein CTI12_AA319010 [Artemisia annua]